jgi:DNA/RNA-binding domain of Phe-tRNA-synthetase-like protein
MNGPIAFRVAGEVAHVLTAGVLWYRDLTVVEEDARLDGPLREAAFRAPPELPPQAAAVRSMYRAIGIDPTRRRPSSEALWRRVRRGEQLPRVNGLVDVCNWCSLELQLPYGLYDADRIDGPVELRLGLPGEAYSGIRKDVVNVAGRIVLADRSGPFGNPTSDSARTMVTSATTGAIVVLFVPGGVAPARIREALDITSERIVRFAGGREEGRWISLETRTSNSQPHK